MLCWVLRRSICSNRSMYLRPRRTSHITHKPVLRPIRDKVGTFPTAAWISRKMIQMLTNRQRSLHVQLSIFPHHGDTLA